MSDFVNNLRGSAIAHGCPKGENNTMTPRNRTDHPTLFSIPSSCYLFILSLSLLVGVAGCDQATQSQATQSQATQSQATQSQATQSQATQSQATGLQALKGKALKLVTEDRRALPVILPENAPPDTKDAANLLAECVEKISGVRPEIIEGLPGVLPDRAIWIGYQPAMDALFPGVDFTYALPEEIVMAGNENHVAITGRDKWDPEFPTLPGRRFPIENWQKEAGTANAVFTFLQDVVGVRWLYPGELGTDYPGEEALGIQPFTYRYHPQFRSRAGIFHQLDRGYIKAGDTQSWAKHQRVLLHSLSMNGGHYFKDWWDKYGETRPELFALQPDGTRGTFPAETHRKKLCEGEPLVWETWLIEQTEHLAKHPYDTILPAMPNDGYFSGHCTDPRSRAWDPDPSETDIRVNVGWAGHKEEWVPLSDRYVTFVNTLADMVKERWPNEELFVSTNAYGDVGRPKPVRAVPRDNVVIISVANFHMRNKAMREQHIQDFLNWASISKNIIWRPNLGNHGGRNWGMPDVPFQEAMVDFRFVADHGAIGVFFDMLYEHWAPVAPYYYLVCQLAWNPYADGNAILNDYFQRCYGPAAGPMKEYWLIMEKTRNEMVEKGANPLSALFIPDHYTPEFFARAADLIEQAKSLVQSSEKFTQRVAFTESGLIFAQRITEIRTLMAQFESAKKDERAPIGAQVVEQWEQLEKLATDLPPYAINFKRFSGGSAKRVTGLHPDVPVKASTLRQLRESGLDLE